MDNIALITGASSGIGAATACMLANKGFKIILCGRQEAKLNQLEKELNKIVQVKTLTFDIAKFEEVKQAFQSLDQTWQNNIKVLVNNAGGDFSFGSLVDSDPMSWGLTLDTNVKGILNISKLIIPNMIKNKKGHIVNLSSIAGKNTYENGIVYCASKKSVEALSEGMRLELTRYGIKITNIAPGAVRTEFSNTRFQGDEKRASAVYEGFKPLLAEDIADVISYAITAPEHVTLGDITIFARAQASVYQIHRGEGL